MSVQIARGTVNAASTQWTEGAITLAVSSGGSDTPTVARPEKIAKAGDYSAVPFATPQAAYNALPKGLTADVLIVNGAGTFTGFIAAGFIGNGKIRHIGATTLATIASGSNAGTAGSGTTGTSMNKPTAAANWTASDLRGKFLKVNSGGGSSGSSTAPTIRPIKSNTTTALAIDNIPGLDNTSVFEIVDMTTIFTAAPGTQFGIGARIGFANCMARIELQMMKAVENASSFAFLAWNCQSVTASAMDLSASSGFAAYGLSCDEFFISDMLLGGICQPYSCRWSDLFRVVIQAAGRIDSQYIDNHNIIADALSCTGTAVRGRNCLSMSLTLNANSCAVVPLDLYNINNFRTGGLTGSNATPTRFAVFAGGGQYIITGATGSGSSSDQFDLEGRAGSYAELSGVNSGTYAARGTHLHWGSGYTVYQTKLRVEGGEVGDDFDELITNNMVIGGIVKHYGAWQSLDPAYKELTAHAGGGQASAAVVGYRDTIVLNAASPGDSARLVSTAEIAYAGGLIGSVANVSANSINLFPPSGKKIFLNGVDQGANTAIAMAVGDYIVWLARNDQNFNVWRVSSLAGAGSFTAGLIVTQSTTNGTGTTTTGNGTGAGLLTTGGSGGGSGLRANAGAGAQYGIEAYGVSGGDAAVFATASGASYGVHGIGGIAGVYGSGSSYGVLGIGQSGAPGVLGNGGTNGVGVHGDGDGTAAGGVFIGGNSNGDGVQGSATGTGNALKGTQTASGYCLKLAADTTSPVKAAISISPQDADPTGAHTVGDVYIATSGVARICTVAGTPGKWSDIAINSTNAAVTAAGVNSQANATLLTSQISYVTAGSQSDPAGVKLPPGRQAGEIWMVWNAVSGPATANQGIAVWPSSGETILPNAVNVRDYLQSSMIGYYISLGSGNWRAYNLPMKSDASSIVNSGTHYFYQLLNAQSGITSSGDIVVQSSSSVYGHLEKQNVQSGTTYTFQASDSGKAVIFTNASAVTVTIPQTLLAGWNVRWEQRGAGQVDFSGTAVTAATLNNRQSQTKSAGQYAVGGITVYTAGTPAVATLFGDTGV